MDTYLEEESSFYPFMTNDKVDGTVADYMLVVI